LAGEQTAHIADLDDGGLRRALRLAVKKLGHGRDGVKLEGLVRVELELHSLNRAPSNVFFDDVVHGVGRDIGASRPLDSAEHDFRLSENGWITQRLEYSAVASPTRAFTSSEPASAT
jgi:hypothetical protein